MLRNLLGSGKGCTDSRLEGRIVGMVAGELPFNRVLNLLGELKERKVNNARTRGLGRWVWGQVDAYRAIKYRDKVRAVLRHCHIPEGDDPARAELHRWVFGKLTRADEVAHNPKLASRLRAGSDYRALFDLPFDIARDIAVASHGKKPDEFEREFAGRRQGGGREPGGCRHPQGEPAGPVAHRGHRGRLPAVQPPRAPPARAPEPPTTGRPCWASSGRRPGSLPGGSRFPPGPPWWWTTA